MDSGGKGNTKHRRIWEAATLLALRDRLRAGDIWVEGSRQWRAVEDKLIPPTLFAAMREAGPLPVAVPAPDLERIGVDQHEHAPERVVQRNAVRQIQERPGPSQLAAAIQRDVVPTLGASYDRAYRDHQHLNQVVFDLARAARVLDRN